jgi:hypothetical protein
MACLDAAQQITWTTTLSLFRAQFIFLLYFQSPWSTAKTGAEAQARCCCCLLSLFRGRLDESPITGLPPFCTHIQHPIDQLAIVTKTTPPTHPPVRRVCALPPTSPPPHPQSASADTHTHTHHFRPPSNELSETHCNRPRVQLLARQQHCFTRTSLSFNQSTIACSPLHFVRPDLSCTSTTSLAAHTVALGPQMGSLHSLSLDVRPCS